LDGASSGYENSLEAAARAAVEALLDSYDPHGDPAGFVDMIEAILKEKPE
jgi:hypothetical protein